MFFEWANSGLQDGRIFVDRIGAGVHDHAANAGSPGVAFETLDMVRANKLVRVVVDGSTAMEGNGPGNGEIVPMDHRWYQSTGDRYGLDDRYGL